MKKNKLITKLSYGFEGYAPQSDMPAGPLSSPVEGYGEHYDGPVKDKFSCTYRIIDEDPENVITFCFLLDKEESIYLEDVMLNEIAFRQRRSETFYNYEGKIFMTCHMGSLPIISIPNRGFSFRFYKNEEYDELLNMLREFLDKNLSRDDNLGRLRKDLKKIREESVESSKKLRRK